MNAAGRPVKGRPAFLRPVDILAAARPSLQLRGARRVVVVFPAAVREDVGLWNTAALARGKIHGSKRRYFIFLNSLDFLRFLMCTFVIEYIKKSIFTIDYQAGQ